MPNPERSLQSPIERSAVASTGWCGFAVTREAPEKTFSDVWAIDPTHSGWKVELSFAEARDWSELARVLFGAGSATADVFVLDDDAAQKHCIVALESDRLVGALFVAREPIEIAREWLVARLGTLLDAGERFRLLSGRPSGAMKPRGPTVCICCDIDQNEIIEAIASGCNSVQAVGNFCRAGTHCGNCRPKIGAYLELWMPRMAEPR